MTITEQQVQEALVSLPSHRVDLRNDLIKMRGLINRGIEVQDTAPAWIQAQNVIFVTAIDKGEPEAGE